MHAHQHALCRFEIIGTEYHAADAQGVDCRAGREVDGEAVEDVAFVKVFDGVGKVYGVCGAVAEGIAEFNGQTSSVGAHRGWLAHGRADYNLVEGVVNLDILVEVHYQTLAVEVKLPCGRIRRQRHRRFHIAGTAFGPAHAGA